MIPIRFLACCRVCLYLHLNSFFASIDVGGDNFRMLSGRFRFDFFDDKFFDGLFYGLSKSSGIVDHWPKRAV